jgi:alpha-D-ribose 1-methylphosphonate 5-triphosphate synthase subunit PhnG
MQGDTADLSRSEAMAVLARAPGETLARLWRESGLPDEGVPLRRPETGLVALRGRIGGGGAMVSTITAAISPELTSARTGTSMR